jgi:uncharacterized protein (TIGR02117 family)
MFAALLALTACTAPPALPTEDAAAGAEVEIFVISSGWHTGIAVARADLPPGRPAEATDFPATRFMEFGWGDAAFYPADEVTVSMALRAALTPTPAVMHVAAFDVTPAEVFGEAAIPLRLSAENFARLVDAIDDSFARDGTGRAQSSGPGLYAVSRFYPATGRFHLFNTCNTWAARVLKRAGMAITAEGVITADDLKRQLGPPVAN